MMNAGRGSFVLSVFVLLLPFASHCPGQEQYKTIARDSLARIADGDCEAAIRRSEDYLRRHPKDLESLYVLAVACAQKKDIEKSLSCVAEAVEAGLPFERFQAGPRQLLRPLTESGEFAWLAEKHGRSLLHGPLLSVADTEVRCWVRTAEETRVGFRVRDIAPGEKGPGAGRGATSGRTDKRNDFTAVLSLSGLEPDTAYEYDLEIPAGKTTCQGRFRTFPRRGKSAKFEVGFGGGAGYEPENERMWHTLAAHNLAAFLFLGDNVYIDHPTRPAVQDYCYYRRQSRPEFRTFTARTPIYAIWDDHDFADDDGWGGPAIAEPEWKLPVWRKFRNNWNNPYYGGGESQPGCWFDFTVADVDFFMLDGRYYRPKAARQGVDVENPSMLGAAQKKWLLEKLGNSKATFRVLVSPVPWSFGAKPGIGAMDTWEGFQSEREEIFSFLERRGIGGVILLSADRHRSDVWEIRRENAHPLYEFESSRLTNTHTHNLMPGAVFGYNKKCSFGVLAFDTTLPDPTVTYRIVSIDNEVVYAFVVRKSQLTYGK